MGGLSYACRLTSSSPLKADLFQEVYITSNTNYVYVTTVSILTV